MVSGIHRRHINCKDSYIFYAGCSEGKRWQFMFRDKERAELSHKRMTAIEKCVCTIYTYLRNQEEYKHMEQDLKILAEQSGNSWTTDTLYAHLKMLFLMSGPDEEAWFCCAAFCQLAIRRDIRDMKPPVIRRYEERFAYIEECLEREGKIQELAYAQVARDTAFRRQEMDSLEWEDVAYPRIILRIPRKTKKEDMFGIISKKTYDTLQKLEHSSERIFNNAGERLRRNISRVSDGTFRFLDYRHCYQLNITWNEIINPAAPVSGKENV